VRIGVPKAKRRYVRKTRVTVSDVAAAVENHGKRLDDFAAEIAHVTGRVEELAHLPAKMIQLSADTGIMRETLQGMLGALGLNQRSLTRVQLSIAAKLEVVVAPADIERLREPLPGEPSFPAKLS
jgi:anti-sigma-K factor RskA